MDLVVLCRECGENWVTPSEEFCYQCDELAE